MEYRFGHLRLNLDERALHCDGAVIPLPPRAIAALTVLASRLGEIVPKESLMEAIWGEAPVEEANLTQNIYRLRQALAEYDPSVRIENIPRRGYRLVAEPAMEVTRSAANRRVWWLSSAACAICAAFALFLYFDTRAPAPPPIPQSFVTGYSLWSTAKSTSDVQRSVLYFTRATEEQPASALGYAGLAYAHLSLALRDSSPEAQAGDVRAGFVAARRAVAVDPNSSAAHAALGQAHALFDDPVIAERELRRAVQLEPDSTEARTWYGELLMSRGQTASAKPQLRAALSQNAQWTEAGDDLAQIAYLERDFSSAAAFAQQSVEQNPRDDFASYLLALARAQSHDRGAAEKTLRPFATARDSADSLRAHALLSLLYLQDGQHGVADAEFAAVRKTIRHLGVVNNPQTIISIAATLALRSERATAFAWLARMDSSERSLLAADARLDVLRSDPRFIRWRARM